jgi:hypothetical protein
MGYQRIHVRYLDPSGPQRQFSVPSRDWFRYGPNGTVSMIDGALGKVITLFTTGLELVQTGLDRPGDLASAFCEITCADDRAYRLVLELPVMASPEELERLDDRCCPSDGHGGCGGCCTVVNEVLEGMVEDGGTNEDTSPPWSERLSSVYDGSVGIVLEGSITVPADTPCGAVNGWTISGQFSALMTLYGLDPSATTGTTPPITSQPAGVVRLVPVSDVVVLPDTSFEVASKHAGVPVGQFSAYFAMPGVFADGDSHTHLSGRLLPASGVIAPGEYRCMVVFDPSEFGPVWPACYEAGYQAEGLAVSAQCELSFRSLNCGALQ